MLREGNAHYRHNLKALWTHTNLIPEKIKTSPFLKGASSPQRWGNWLSVPLCLETQKWKSIILSWLREALLWPTPVTSLSIWGTQNCFSGSCRTDCEDWISFFSLPPSLHHFFSSSSCSLATPTFFFFFLRIVVFLKDFFDMDHFSENLYWICYNTASAFLCLWFLLATRHMVS